MGIKFGLPYLHHWDEPQAASTALRILKTGDYNPHFFHWAGFNIYSSLVIDIFHYYYLMGKDVHNENYLDNLDDIQINSDTGWHWEISHPSFFLWNRAFTALLGSLSLVLVFFIGKELRNRWTGLLALGLLAGFSTHIEHSRYVTPDLAASFWTLLTVLFALKFFKSGQLSHLILASLFAGFSAGTKYNAALSLSSVLTAYLFVLFRGKKVGYYLKLLPLIFLVTAIGFLIWNPYSLLDLPNFLRQSGWEIRHYRIWGHETTSIAPGWTHFMFQIRTIQDNISPVLLYLSFLGLILSLSAWRKSVIVLVFPAVYMLYMCQQIVSFHRNFLLIYPFLSVYSGLAISSMTRALSKILDDFGAKRGFRSRRLSSALPLLSYVPLVGLILYLGGDYIGRLAQAKLLWNHRETRSQAIDYVNSISLLARIEKIGIAEELRFHRIELNKLRVDFDVLPHEDLLEKVTSYDLVMTGSFYSFTKLEKERAEAMNRRVPENKVLHTIGANFVNLDAISIDPKIMFLSENLPQELLTQQIPHIIPVPGDYDGDGKTDKSVWNLNDGKWTIQHSSGDTAVLSWGSSGYIPVPRDFNGDGKTDIAAWELRDGHWFIKDGKSLKFGLSQDIPVPEDYDGDGKADIAVWRLSDGCWYIRDSSERVTSSHWGTRGDIPVPEDYDGDGRVDIAVWRPSEGLWNIRLSSGQTVAAQWGSKGDIPVPGDYDGDGKTDVALWRPSDGFWYIQFSSGTIAYSKPF